MTQPSQRHPEWANTGPLCDYLPTPNPTAWHRLLYVQTAAETLQSLSDRSSELDRQYCHDTSHALRTIAAYLEEDTRKHHAALASGTPPTKPTAETVADAKLLLANARQQLPKPDNSAGNQEPDPWHDAIAHIFNGEILMTAISKRRDEYMAGGPEAAAAWRQTIDRLAHQCRHHDDDLRHQKSQTPARPGPRSRRRLLAQATGASRSALRTYHETVAGPRRQMPVHYGEQDQGVGLNNLIEAEQIRQAAASDAAPVVIVQLEDNAETAPILVVEHRSELHVLLTTDTMPPGLPAASLLHTHLSRQIEDILTEGQNDPPAWGFPIQGLLDAAVAGIHDTPPATLRQLGDAIRTAVNSDPHGLSLLEDAVEDYLGYYLTGWLFMHCRLLSTINDEWNADDDEVEAPYFTPAQNRALLNAGAAAGISPYGLKRLALAIGADPEPDYNDQLPEHTPATVTAVHNALRQVTPDQPEIRQALAHILQTALGIPEP